MTSYASHRYIIPANPKNWKANLRFVNELLRRDFLVEWVLRTFNVHTLGSVNEKKPTTYPADSFLVEIPNDRNSSTNISEFLEKASSHKIKTIEIQGPAKIKTLKLNTSVVGLFANGGSPFPFAPILAEVGIEHVPLSVDDINNGGLRGVRSSILESTAATLLE